jgi:hypothetical protein
MQSLTVRIQTHANTIYRTKTVLKRVLLTFSTGVRRIFDSCACVVLVAQQHFRSKTVILHKYSANNESCFRKVQVFWVKYKRKCLLLLLVLLLLLLASSDGC